MALSFFPQPYPDEIMYSVIARYHHISGNKSNAASSIDLFNCRRIQPSIALQGKLGVLARNSERFGVSFDTLLFEHTMFPYIMVFTSPEKYERVYNWAKYSDNGFDRFTTGGIRGNVYPEKLMYCPECLKEDNILLGEAYWHRIHQVPGIAICQVHHRYLLSSSVPTFNHETSSFQVLQEEVMQVIDPTKQTYAPGDFFHNDGIFHDTKFLYDNFIRVRKLFVDYGCCFRNAFLPELINKQLAKKGRLKLTEMITSFINFYGVNYLNKIGLPVSDSNNKWPISLCRENGKQHTFALKYILMARFLFGSFENFINEMQNQTRFCISIPPIKPINQISLKNYRNKWLTLISETPDKGRVAVRNLDPATYFWLSRHDLTWLKEHLPEKKIGHRFISKPFNWNERDKNLSEQVESVIEPLKNSIKKPIRISQSRICIALGCKPMLTSNWNKLPLTRLAINNAVETVEQFRLRRCYWIINSLQIEGIHPTPENVCAILHPPNKSEWKKIIESILEEKMYQP